MMPSSNAAVHGGHEFLRERHVRQEYTCTAIGTIAIAVSQCVSCKNKEKKRWSEIFKTVLGLLGLDYTRVRTEIVDLLRKNSEVCVTVNNQEMQIFYNEAVKSGFPLNELSDAYSVFAQALNYMVLGEDAKGCSTRIAVFKQLCTFFKQVAMNKYSGGSSPSSSSVREAARLSSWRLSLRARGAESGCANFRLQLKGVVFLAFVGMFFYQIYVKLHDCE